MEGAWATAAKGWERRPGGLVPPGPSCPGARPQHGIGRGRPRAGRGGRHLERCEALSGRPAGEELAEMTDAGDRHGPSRAATHVTLLELAACQLTTPHKLQAEARVRNYPGSGGVSLLQENRWPQACQLHAVVRLRLVPSLVKAL